MNSGARTAIILAGGFGTRLRSLISDVPKPMAPAAGKPFLFWLVQSLEKAGFSSFIFSTGYKAEVIESYSWRKEVPSSQFSFSREETPLGTGGAVRLAFEKRDDLTEAWVMNGDTLLENPLPPFLTKPRDLALYSVLEKGDVFDAKPNIQIKGPQVLGVGEEGGTYFDAGQIYLSREAVFESAIEAPCSIHEILKPLFLANKVRYKIIDGRCFDIGTPERLARFEDFLKENSLSV